MLKSLVENGTLQGQIFGCTVSKLKHNLIATASHLDSYDIREWSVWGPIAILWKTFNWGSPMIKYA